MVLFTRAGDKKSIQNMIKQAWQIFEKHDNVVLHASLSAKSIYLKRGYREIEYRTKKTENSDYLCVDIMQKKKQMQDSAF